MSRVTASAKRKSAGSVSHNFDYSTTNQTDRTGLGEVSDLFLADEKGMVQFHSPFGCEDLTSPYFTQLTARLDHGCGYQLLCDRLDCVFRLSDI